MLRLNIIPKPLKYEIRMQVNFIRIKNLLAILLLLVLLYSITFVVSRLILELHAIRTIYETITTTITKDNRSKQVRTINNDIDLVNDIQADSVEWSYFLEMLMKKIPADITLNRITANKNTNIIILAGTAGTRDSLLDLKELLEATPELNNVELPIKNLLQKENINFEISAQFVNYEFKNQIK